MLNGDRVIVWEKKKLVAMDSGAGYTKCECTLCHLTLHLKTAKMVNLCNVHVVTELCHPETHGDVLTFIPQ